MERLVLLAILAVAVFWLVRHIASSIRSAGAASGSCAGCAFRAACRGETDTRSGCEEGNDGA